MIRIPSKHSFVGVGEVKGRKLGDTLSYAYHSTPPPLRWHEWPDIPSVTTHFPKKMCHVSPGQSTISDPHLRTLALQVYPNMLRSESASSYQDLVKLVDAGSSTAKLQWEYAGNVQFPHNGALPAERFSGPSWKEMSTTEQTTTVKAPMMFYMMANDAAKLFPPTLLCGTDWQNMTQSTRLIFAAFPTSRYLSRVVCHSRAIIGVLCGEGRLAWTTPEIFYSGLDVVRGKNRRHGIDINFVDSQSHRDFHRVDHVDTGMCLYIRSGAVIQMWIEANTMLVMVVDDDVDVDPKFERLSSWLVRVKGQIV